MRPPDVLAARLLAEGAQTVSIYSNVVTVEVAPDAVAAFDERAQYLVEHLFEFYGDTAQHERNALTEGMGIDP